MLPLNHHHHHQQQHQQRSEHQYSQQQQQQTRSPPPPVLHPADAASSSSHPPHTPRPPAKRSRKAINCEPCRASKLKCDRARPCSSCVLRGTTALCYQGDPRVDSSEHIKLDETSRVDPHQELARIRQSLNLLETHIARSPSWLANGAPPPTPASAFPHADHSPRPHQQIPALKQESFDSSSPEPIPGSLTQTPTGDAGLYAGATSLATLFATFKHDLDPDEEVAVHISVLSDPGPSTNYSPRDYDLLSMLPEISIVDGLLAHYFDNCQWENRFLHYHAFSNAWAGFKSNIPSDRLVLAAVFMVLAIAVHFLPSHHTLIESLPESSAILSENYYSMACTTLQRYRTERRTYSLELVELLLLRIHYLIITKGQSEELWAIRGELVSTAISMGLHRDPGQFKMSRDVAERRRWAWWNIMFTERWLAFILGRPLAIYNSHFDTQFPSCFDSSYDPTGRLHLPHIHMFRFSETLGDIMEDAVAVRPVLYERVLAHDKTLERWMQTFPAELDLDEYTLSRSLSSTVLSVRRFASQSICARMLFYHVRFILHKPYSGRNQQSLDIAIHAAESLAQLARPDFLSGSTPGNIHPPHSHLHVCLHWGAFHAFAAAMFLGYQLSIVPEQARATLFRSNIKRVLHALEHLRHLGPSAGGGGPQAFVEKAIAILQALEDIPVDEEKKAQVIRFVGRLPFPCHDPPGYVRRASAGTQGGQGMQERMSPGPSRTAIAGPGRASGPGAGPGQGTQGAAGSPADSISPPEGATPSASAAALPGQAQQQLQQAQQQQAQQAQQHHAPPPTTQYAQPAQGGPADVYDGSPYGHHHHPHHHHHPTADTVWGTSIGVDSEDWAHV